jgi:predicted ferric reductase
VSKSPPRRPATRIPAWWRDLTGATAWMLVLFVVALWVAGGGLTAFGSPAAGLTSLGRLAGLVASVLMLLQVLLMARIPMVEQAWGQDELARVHRLVGFTSFNLMVAHIVLITLGYAGHYGNNPFAELWEFVVDYPGMLLATASTVLLILVSEAAAVFVFLATRDTNYGDFGLWH